MTALPSTTGESATSSRVRYRPRTSHGGYVDAGWWPRSWDLEAELPALFASVWSSGRAMTRVAYNLDTWDTAPRELLIKGRKLHVGGYHQQNPLVMSMSDVRHNDTLDVLVIPFDTDEAVAGRLLDLGSESDNLDTPQDMFESAHETRP